MSEQGFPPVVGEENVRVGAFGTRPSGTVTFLFTDIEGSTRLWEVASPGMAEALALHDSIVRSAVERHSGVVFATGGDGFAVAFSRASDAVAAAADAQTELGSTEWPDGMDLRVRMGLHSGEAAERDGDYFGPAVNRAARLMAVGHGGQVLVSGATRGLVDTQQFVDLGLHRLRDLSEPEHVFQLLRPAFPSEFPALRTVDTFATNLPVQLTSFVGRNDELVAIGELLGRNRLVTITGVGGVGKTRLALHAAADLLPRFEDGVWLCELAAVGDAPGVAQAIAVTFGVDTRGEQVATRAVARFLQSKDLLLLFDNCEHVLVAVADLTSEVLSASSAVRVLATSREGLGVPGEQVFPLRPLTVGDGASDVQAAWTQPAVQLFVERARLARPTFQLTEENVRAVDDVCRRLDGIPLAIELAAARTVAFSPAEIAGHLDERFRLLKGARTRSVDRHQTLRATIDWSYSMLSEAERAVFDRLAVFAGGFSADAAAAVAAGAAGDHWDVVEVLAALVRKSMVLSEEDAAGRTRYVLLETLRQYAEERLEELRASDETRRAHAEFMADFAERLESRLAGTDERAARAELLAELDNLRSALLWSIDRSGEEESSGARIAGALADESARDPALGIGAWATLAAPAAERFGRRAHASVAGMRAYLELGFSHHDQVQRFVADTLEATGVYTAPLATGAAFSLMLTGDTKRALAILEQAEAALSADDNPRDLGWLAHTKAYVLALGEDRAVGVPAAEAALAFARRSGNPSSLGWAHVGLGFALLGTDDRRALQLLETAIDEYGDVLGIMLTPALTHLAEAYARSGDEHCLVQLRDAVEWVHYIDYRPQMTTVISTCAVAFTMLGKMEEAAVTGGIADGELRTHDALGHHERTFRSQCLRRASAALGDTRYEMARKQGLDMSYDSAVQFLRETLPAPKRLWGPQSSRRTR